VRALRAGLVGLSLGLLLAFAGREVVGQERAGSGPGVTPGIAAHGGPVRAIAVGPAGLASGGLDQAVIFWSPSGQPRLVSRWHRGAVEALIAIPGGGFASAADDGSIAIWPAMGAVVPDATLQGHAGPVLALASDGVRLASGGFDGVVRIRDGDGAVTAFEGHRGAVTGLAFTPPGLVSAGRDGTLRLWPEGRVLAEYGAPLAALVALGSGAGTGVPDGAGSAFGGAGATTGSAGGAGVAAAGADGVIRLPDGRELATGPRPLVALAERDGILAAGSIGGDVGLWDWRAGRLLRVLDGPGLPVWSLGFAADGTLWTGGADRQLRRWDVMSGRPLAETAVAAWAPPAGADLAGARVFRACQACHALGADAPAMAGPTLHRLFGRRMGSVPGYAYSERLARGDIVWTPEAVADLFTRGPDVVTPGTRMPVQTVGNAEDLAALLRFLAVAPEAEPPAR